MTRGTIPCKQYIQPSVPHHHLVVAASLRLKVGSLELSALYLKGTDPVLGISSALGYQVDIIPFSHLLI